RLVFGGECHDLAKPLVELHADSFCASSKRAGFGLEQEVREGHHLVGEGGEPAHYDQKIASMQWPAIVIQHLDHDGAFTPLLHGGAIETEMVPQYRCAVGVAAELMVRQERAALVTFGRH